MTHYRFGLSMKMERNQKSKILTKEMFGQCIATHKHWKEDSQDESGLPTPKMFGELDKM